MFGHLDSNIDHVDTHKEMKVDRPESSVYVSTLRNWYYVIDIT